MKVVVSGGWSYGNIGDEAIAKSTIYLCEQCFPQATIEVYAYNTAQFEELHERKVKVSVHKIVDEVPIETLDRLKEYIEQPEKYGLQEFAEDMSEDTLFIMAGGGYFSDRWASQYVARILEIEIAKSRGAKVAVIGQSIGPIYDTPYRRFFVDAMKKCDYINVRDRETYDFMTDLLGDKEIKLGIDTAVIISDVMPKQTDEKKKVLNVMAAGYSDYTTIKGNRIRNRTFYKIMCRVTLRYYIYEYRFKKIVKELAKDEDVYVRFIMSTLWDYDLAFTKRVAKGLQPGKYEIIDQPSMSEFCGYISRGDAMISTKMHPIVISSSYNIKSIAFSYGFKVDNFMKMIGSYENCYRNTKISIKEVVMKVKSIMEHKEKLPERNMEELRRKVYEMGQDMAVIAGKKEK